MSEHQSLSENNRPSPEGFSYLTAVRSNCKINARCEWTPISQSEGQEIASRPRRVTFSDGPKYAPYRSSTYKGNSNSDYLAGAGYFTTTKTFPNVPALEDTNYWDSDDDENTNAEISRCRAADQRPDSWRRRNAEMWVAEDAARTEAIRIPKSKPSTVHMRATRAIWRLNELKDRWSSSDDLYPSGLIARAKSSSSSRLQAPASVRSNPDVPSSEHPSEASSQLSTDLTSMALRSNTPPVDVKDSKSVLPRTASCCRKSAIKSRNNPYAAEETFTYLQELVRVEQTESHEQDINLVPIADSDLSESKLAQRAQHKIIDSNLYEKSGYYLICK